MDKSDELEIREADKSMTLRLLPEPSDERVAVVRHLLATLAAMEFVEVVVVGVKARARGFATFGSNGADILRMVGCLEVAKRDLLLQLRGNPDDVPPLP